MKILFAADGSTFTKKALAFLVKNESLIGPSDELVVLHVQDDISAQIERALGSAEVTAYQAKQADAVLKPIKKFLDKHGVKYRCLWVAGAAARARTGTACRAGCSWAAWRSACWLKAKFRPCW
jgi:Universal stress protein family